MLRNLLILLLMQPTTTSTLGKPKIQVQRGAFEQDLQKTTFVVQITTKNSENDSICGGTVIGDNVILSAAHCFCDDLGNPMLPSEFEIVLPVAENREGRGPLKVSIKELVVHPEYNFKSKTNDIVMIVTSSSLTDLGIKPIQLADKGFNPSGQATYVGYRDSKSVYYKIWIIPDEDCNNWFHQKSVTRTTHQDQVCGYEPGRQVHHGDSGGPLICRHKNNLPFLCGIVSFGISRRKGSLPDVYTNVGNYIDFIDSIYADKHLEQVKFALIPLIILCVAYLLYYWKSRRKLLNATEPNLLKLSLNETVPFETDV